MNEYEVRVTRLALEQMKEIVHYISNDLMAPDAADNLLDIRITIKVYSCKYIKLNTRNERSRYVEIFHVTAFFMQLYIPHRRCVPAGY